MAWPGASQHSTCTTFPCLQFPVLHARSKTQTENPWRVVVLRPGRAVEGTAVCATFCVVRAELARLGGIGRRDLADAAIGCVLATCSTHRNHFQCMF